jgi:hypothetical protein
MRNPRTSSDAPAEISGEESREELLGGRPPPSGILGPWDLVAVVVAIVACILVALTLEDTSQWVLLGGIILAAGGLIVAVRPDRDQTL